MKRASYLKFITLGLLILILAGGIISYKIIFSKPRKAKPVSSKVTTEYDAPKADKAPSIDGKGKDKCWKAAPWADINFSWGGTQPETYNFSGRYKIAWTPEKLYYLIEINDNELYDSHPYPFDSIEKDDCLQLFLDEDHSGGYTKNNYNAFKYYIDINNFVSTVGVGYRPFLLNEHMELKRSDVGSLHTWEIGLKVYGDDYSETSENNIPVKLKANKVLGYAIAYIDNDDSTEGSYMGSYNKKGSRFNDKDPNATSDSFNVLKLMP